MMKRTTHRLIKAFLALCIAFPTEVAHAAPKVHAHEMLLSGNTGIQALQARSLYSGRLPLVERGASFLGSVRVPDFIRPLDSGEDWYPATPRPVQALVAAAFLMTAVALLICPEWFSGAASAWGGGLEDSPLLLSAAMLVPGQFDLGDSERSPQRFAQTIESFWENQLTPNRRFALAELFRSIESTHGLPQRDFVSRFTEALQTLFVGTNAPGSLTPGTAEYAGFTESITNIVDFGSMEPHSEAEGAGHMETLRGLFFEHHPHLEKRPSPTDNKTRPLMNAKRRRAFYSPYAGYDVLNALHLTDATLKDSAVFLDLTGTAGTFSAAASPHVKQVFYVEGKRMAVSLAKRLMSFAARADIQRRLMTEQSLGIYALAREHEASGEPPAPLGNVRFIRTQAYALPLPEDSVTHIAVIDYLPLFGPRGRYVFRQLLRVAKPEGLILIKGPDNLAFSEAYQKHFILEAAAAGVVLGVANAKTNINATVFRIVKKGLRPVDLLPKNEEPKAAVITKSAVRHRPPKTQKAHPLRKVNARGASERMFLKFKAGGHTHKEFSAGEVLEILLRSDSASRDTDVLLDVSEGSGIVGAAAAPYVKHVIFAGPDRRRFPVVRELIAYAGHPEMTRRLMREKSGNHKALIAEYKDSGAPGATAQNVSYLRTDLQSIALPDNAVTYVNAVDVPVLLTTRWKDFLLEMLRVTKPGGRLHFRRPRSRHESKLYSTLYVRAAAQAGIELLPVGPENEALGMFFRIVAKGIHLQGQTFLHGPEVKGPEEVLIERYAAELVGDNDAARLYVGTDLWEEGVKRVLKVSKSVKQNFYMENEYRRLYEIQLAKISRPEFDFPRVIRTGTLPDGRLYLVLDHFEGHNLLSDLFSDGLSPVGFRSRTVEVMHIFQTILGAVQALHQLKILHLHLKPQNILISREGGQIKIRIIDFALAAAAPVTPKTLRKRPDATLGHFASEFRGSPRYWVGPYTDIFSLGVIAFAYLTQALPNGSATLDEELGNADWLDVQHPGLRSIIRKATHENPALRYRSAKAFAHDLQIVVAPHDVNISNSGPSAPSHAAVNAAISEFRRAKQVTPLPAEDMLEILGVLSKRSDLASISRRLSSEGYRVYLYGEDTTMDLAHGQTTHAGIRTKSIHLARGEYLRLKQREKDTGRPYLAARIAHEVHEISEWRRTATMRGQNPDSDYIRLWIKANISKAKMLDEHFHETAVLHFERSIAEDHSLGSEIPISDPDDIDISHAPRDLVPASITHLARFARSWRRIFLGWMVPAIQRLDTIRVFSARRALITAA